jgi:hypothetical protein
MVKNKLHIEPHMDPSDIVRGNQKYFDLAATSIEQNHGHLPNRSDFYDAAEILLLTTDGIDPNILKMPSWDKIKLLRDWDD